MQMVAIVIITPAVDCQVEMSGLQLDRGVWDGGGVVRIISK